MKNFNTFFEAAEDKAMQEPERVSDDAVALFGRHQPPHLGHALTFSKANDIAEEIGGDQMFFSSRSQDPKQNPLPFLLKMMFLKKMIADRAEVFAEWSNGIRPNQRTSGEHRSSQLMAQIDQLS